MKRQIVQFGPPAKDGMIFAEGCLPLLITLHVAYDFRPEEIVGAVDLMADGSGEIRFEPQHHIDEENVGEIVLGFRSLESHVGADGVTVHDKIDPVVCGILRQP